VRVVPIGKLFEKKIRLAARLAAGKVAPPNVRYWVAGSTGRRNTGVKSLCWGFKLQGLTWSFV